MSRAHPGKSEIYKNKMKIRNKRECERELFKQAKD